MDTTKNIFVLYSSNDEDAIPNFLLTTSSILQDFTLSLSSDNAVDNRELWKPLEVLNLKTADVYLFLLSHSLLNSEFFQQDDFEIVVERFKEGKAIIVPVLLDDSQWNVKFSSEHHNFNFSELKIFNKDASQIGNWNPVDKVFTEVAYYMMGLFTSNAVNFGTEAAVIAEEKRRLELEREGQIAFNFNEEKELANKELANKVEGETIDELEVNIKRILEEEHKAAEDAELRELIRKEKRSRQKIENQKRIEIEVQAKRVLQGEIRENEIVKTQLPVNEIVHDDVMVSHETAERGTIANEVAVASKRVPNKDLARYNYQFTNKKTVHTRGKDAIRQRLNEKVEPKIVLEKKQVEIVTPQIKTKREKRVDDAISAKKKVPKNNLAKYNYQFKEIINTNTNADEVESLKSSVNGDIKTQTVPKIGLRVRMMQYLQEQELDKRKDEAIAAFKKGTKNMFVKLDDIIVRLKNFKNGSDVQEEPSDIEELKTKSAKKGNLYTFIVKRLQETKWDQRLYTTASAVKSFTNKKYQIIKTSQAENFVSISQYFAKIKGKLSTDKKIRFRSELLIAVVAIFGILTYLFTRKSETPSTAVSQIEEVKVAADTDVVTNNKTDNQAGAMLQLGVGDMYKGGMIFSIDAANKTGKIVHIDDQGPMIWSDAMAIDEQLGEGWRLPTLEELKVIYNSIGQGAENKGEFANELYWSATPFDAYQARLLRFSDGNTSFHYNSVGTFREFRVRAVQDFER